MGNTTLIRSLCKKYIQREMLRLSIQSLRLFDSLYQLVTSQATNSALARDKGFHVLVTEVSSKARAKRPFARRERCMSFAIRRYASYRFPSLFFLSQRAQLGRALSGPAAGASTRSYNRHYCRRSLSPIDPNRDRKSPKDGCSRTRRVTWKRRARVVEA